MVKKKLKPGGFETLESENRFSVLDQSLNFDINDPVVLDENDNHSLVLELRNQLQLLMSRCEKLEMKVKQNETEINLLKQENKNLNETIAGNTDTVEKAREICTNTENKVQNLGEKIENVHVKIEKLPENASLKSETIDYKKRAIWGTSKTASVSFEQPRIYSFAVSKITNNDKYDASWLETELYDSFADHDIDAYISHCSRIPAFYENCATKSFKIVLKTVNNVNDLYNPKIWIAGTKITRFREKGVMIPGNFNSN